MSYTKNFGIFVAVLSIAAVKSQAAELLTNGGFETGDFTGWSVVNQADSSGTFYIASGSTTPLNAFPTVGASEGLYYAVTDQGGPGAHALIQSFTVGAGATAQLSFDMFVNDQSGSGEVNPAGLDFQALPNQHARVDILSGSADPFDTGAGVLGNFYLGVDPGSNPHPYTSYSFDISSIISAGGTFQLRFAEVDNQLFMNLGVDNVSIQARETTGIPDSGSTLVGLALAVGSVISVRRAFKR